MQECICIICMYIFVCVSFSLCVYLISICEYLLTPSSGALTKGMPWTRQALHNFSLEGVVAVCWPRLGRQSTRAHSGLPPCPIKSLMAEIGS